MKKTTYQKIILFLVMSSIATLTFAQNVNLIKNLSIEETQAIRPLEGFDWKTVKIVDISRTAFQNQMRFAPKESADFRARNSNFIVELPLPTGELVAFRLVETALLTPETAIAFPFIKTYRGEQIDHSENVVHLTLSHLGISALIKNGDESIYIRPYDRMGSDSHIVFNKKDEIVPKGVSCGVDSQQIKEELESENRSYRGVSDCQLRTYRIAVAATGEYTTWAGSQANAAANITATINNVKAIYERETTITFTLVLNNAFLYTDPNTDPFTITGSTSSATLTANHNAIVSAIGASAFDLGHLFSNDWNGGLASSPSICSSSNKGKAQSGLNSVNFPSGPTGSIMESTVAHEMAHQFNVSHTMSSSGGGCSGNVTVSTAVETGGGSTLMAYAGVCTGNAYQTQSDQYFHTTSLTQLTSYAISQNTCGAISALSNTAPGLSTTASSYNIPSGTPFLLNVTGSDVNGDALTYTFEQTDAISAATTSNPSSTATNGPNFRSYPPNSSNFRYFPPLANVVAGTTPTFEVLPTVARAMTFRSVVRDNRSGGGCSAEVAWTINTNGTTPFRVSSQNTVTSLTANGSNTFTITWDVANTNTAPVNVANVKISFSTDGGSTFPNILSSSTANDGTETITVPSLVTSAGRIKIEAVGNIFFDINDANITIASGSGCLAEGATVSPTAAVTANAGAGALNLGLSPQYGTAQTSWTANVPTGSPTMPLTFNQNSAGCAAPYSNSPAYTTYTFQVGLSGSYTFTLNSASSTVMNLYQNSFNASSTCSNWLGSSASGTGTTLSSTITASLSSGITYVLVVSGFSTGHAAFTRTVTFTSPSGGSVVLGGAPNPGASYNYAYVVANTATNNVTAIQSNSNLTNSTTFPAGNYNVYGLSYSNATTLSSLQSYVGGALSNLQNAVINSVFCGDFSSNSVSVTINCAVAPTVTISNNNGLNIGCNPTSTTLTASGGVSYVWSTTATNASITVNTGGTYQVTATDAGGCKGVNSVVVSYSVATPNVSIANNNGLELNCAVLSTTLTASGGATYAWSGGGTGNTKVANTGGTYTVTATSTSGCTASVSVSTYTSNAAGATISPTTPVSAVLNNASLDLNLAPVYVSALSISGTLTTSQPTSTGAFVNITAPNCFLANTVRYQTYSFQVNVAGTYTFNKGSNSLVISLYTNTYNSASPCSNLINSGSIYNGASVSNGSSVSATLSTGTTYVLLISSFSPSSPTLPFAYNVTVTPPAGGAIYNTPGTVNPGASYNYTYVIEKSGNIAAINNSSDLSALTTVGSYKVYGLSYHNSISNATLNTYIGGTFAAMQTAISNSTLCASLSSNFTPVDITCPTTTATITPSSTQVCSTGATLLNASAGTNYQWSANAANAITQSVFVGVGSYTVTVTAASGCTATATATITTKSFALPSSNGNLLLTEDCTENGWTIYSSGNQQIFAIEWQPTGSSYSNNVPKSNTQVTISLDAANGASTTASEGTFSMKRYWNVYTGGYSLAGPVNVRFFYAAAEKAATISQATAYATSIGQPTETPTWFKTVGTAFDPATSLTSGGITTAIALTDANAATAATINGVLYAQFNGVTSFSGGGFAAGVGSGLTLPINLVSFIGKKVEQGVDLQWITEREENTRSFTLEKSADGSHFTTMTTIAAAKNANTTQRYAYTDISPLAGDNYYRLMLKDLDGTITQEGKIIVIRFDDKTPVTLYPNPTSGALSIRMESEQAETANIRIFNSLGSIVNETTALLNKGENELTFDLSHLPNGTYCMDLGQAQKYIFVVNR